MKQLCRRVLTAMWVAVCVGVAAAQPLDNTFATDAGLSVSYPAAWSAAQVGELKIDVTHADGWLIAIAAGSDANYEFSGEVYAPPAEIMQHFVDFMILVGSTVGAETAAPIEIGIVAGLYQTFVTNTGVPFEAVAFTLPDGMSVLALLGHQGDPVPVPSEIRETFFAVLSSVSFEAPASVTEPDPFAADDVVEDDAAIPDGAVRISDLAPGTLRFEGGIETAYPDGWMIYTDIPYIEHNISLIYGESIFNYSALAVINVQDSADMSIETFRQELLPMSALLYTGQEDFDPARDIVTETLPDGRVLEYLDVSEAEGIRGNAYATTLDARYWVWVILTVLDPDMVEERAADVQTLLRELTLDLPDDVVVHEGFHLQLEPATCDRVLTSSDVSERAPYALFACPAGCADESYSIWGSDIYTLDSSVCAAAIHAGAFADADGGTVLATWQPGQESYASTERNAILTMDYGSWGNSFMVAPFTLPDNE